MLRSRALASHVKHPGYEGDSFLLQCFFITFNCIDFSSVSPYKYNRSLISGDILALHARY